MTAGVPRRDVVSYEQAHLRLKLWRGRPDTMQCVACAGIAAHWAYLGGDPNELKCDKGRPYSLDMSRYAPMCVSCHKRKDNAHADGRTVDTCPRGHEWNEANTGVRKRRAPGTGLRFCRACNRENAQAWRTARRDDPQFRERRNAAARRWRAERRAPAGDGLRPVPSRRRRSA